METMYDRELPLLGESGLEKIKRARVALFGAGGVGGHAAEALIRGGIGALTIIDGDVFTPSNLNRQRFAALSSLGKNKAIASAEALSDINADAEIAAVPEYFKTGDEFDFSAYDYIVDAVDDIAAKEELIVRSHAAGVPLVCACGAGNKLDPSRFRAADVFETKVCPLARALRRICRLHGINSLRVVYSDEEPLKTPSAPASVSFVPGVMGMIMAGCVLRDLADYR